MAVYKLLKNSDNSLVQIFKDNQEMPLYKDIHDTGIVVHGWGGWRGYSDQLGFAITYDHSQDKEYALENYQKVVKIFNYAAPLELEISSETIQLVLNS